MGVPDVTDFHVSADPSPIPQPRPGEPARRGWFSSDLHVVFISAPGRRRYVRLTWPLTFTRANGEAITAPADFECDGGSIPRWAWWLVGHPLDGDVVRSCVIHDRLVVLGRAKEALELPEGRKVVVTPSYAHGVFKEALEADGVAWWRRNAMWAAVKLASRW